MPYSFPAKHTVFKLAGLSRPSEHEGRPTMQKRELFLCFLFHIQEMLRDAIFPTELAGVWSPLPPQSTPSLENKHIRQLPPLPEVLCSTLMLSALPRRAPLGQGKGKGHTCAQGNPAQQQELDSIACISQN